MYFWDTKVYPLFRASVLYRGFHMHNSYSCYISPSIDPPIKDSRSTIGTAVTKSFTTQKVNSPLFSLTVTEELPKPIETTEDMYDT